MEKLDIKMDNFNQQVDAKFQDQKVYIDGEVSNLVSRIEELNINKTRIVCIRPKGRTQCIFPRLYVLYIDQKVNLYQVVVGQQ